MSRRGPKSPTGVRSIGAEILARPPSQHCGVERNRYSVLFVLCSTIYYDKLSADSCLSRDSNRTLSITLMMMINVHYDFCALKHLKINPEHS